MFLTFYWSIKQIPKNIIFTVFFSKMGCVLYMVRIVRILPVQLAMYFYLYLWERWYMRVKNGTTLCNKSFFPSNRMVWKSTFKHCNFATWKIIFSWKMHMLQSARLSVFHPFSCRKSLELIDASFNYPNRYMRKISKYLSFLARLPLHRPKLLSVIEMTRK